VGEPERHQRACIARGKISKFWIFSTKKRRRGDLTVRMYIAYFLNPPELRPATSTRSSTRAKNFTMTGLMRRRQIHGGWRRGSATRQRCGALQRRQSLKGKLFWEPSKYKIGCRGMDKRGLQLSRTRLENYGVRTALDAYEEAETATASAIAARASNILRRSQRRTFRDSANSG